MNEYTAKLTFTHGEIEVKGTMIFVLASISINSKREGFLSSEMGASMTQAMAAAKQKQIV